MTFKVVIYDTKTVQDWRWTQILISFSSLFCAYKWFFCDLKSDVMMTVMTFICPTIQLHLWSLKCVFWCVYIVGMYHFLMMRHLAHWLQVKRKHISCLHQPLTAIMCFLFLICHTQARDAIYAHTESSHVSYHSQPDTLMTFNIWLSNTITIWFFRPKNTEVRYLHPGWYYCDDIICLHITTHHCNHLTHGSRLIFKFILMMKIIMSVNIAQNTALAQWLP